MIFKIAKILLFGSMSILFGYTLLRKNISFENEDLSAVELTTRMDFVLQDGKIYDRRDTVIICYYNDLVLYREQYFYEVFNKKALHGDTIIISNDVETMDSRELKHDYYIWKNNAKTGLKYNGVSDSSEIINVDSVKIQRLYKKSDFYQTKAKHILVSKKTSPDKKYLTETFLNTFKPDATYYDTVRYVFSNDYRSIPYSFSRKGDSLKNAKLIEANFVYNPIPKSINNQFDIPRREMRFRMKKVVLAEPSSFRKMADRFNKDIQRVK
jgi:hypothetical protein